MTELLENSDNTNESAVVSESPANEATISLAAVQALADALQKIESYTPTVWVDNESPDIDAVHLNKVEQAIMRVTTAMNSAVNVIKDLQSQVNTTNNNLSKFYPGYYYNGTDTTSDIYAAMPNRSALFFSTNGDQKVGNELGFSESYQGANVIIWKSSEWRGGALAIPNAGDGILLMAQISGANTLTWKKNEIASKSDLFAYNWISDPNSCTASFAVVNGWSPEIANVPDDAKNTWNSLQTVWVYPAETGDLTKQRLQTLITGNNTVHIRMYANGNFANWS